MTNQLSFASLAYNSKKKQTKKEKFLSEMDEVIPWIKLLKLIERHYAKASKGRPSYPLEKMLRVYFLQQWYSLSDPGAEEALYDSESMRRFARFELGSDAIPDETTILNFRHLLESKELTKKLFSEIHEYLDNKGLFVKQGTIVDATIIHAPSSTKNENKQRDPEMKQTKKGNQWYFGMKAHVGVDTKTRLVHTVVCTDASVHDSVMMQELLLGDEEKIYGDKAYANETKKAQYESQGIKWCIARKGSKNRALSDKDKEWNRKMSKVRAKGEHAFLVVKKIFGYAKTKYRGISKNAAQQFTLFALANIYLIRKTLLKLNPLYA